MTVVSVVLPTLNAERCLAECLDALLAQEWPREDLEILLVDAGSTDRTLEIAAARGVDRVVANPLRTGEAGKAVGLKAARGDIALLLDSDNVVVGTDWLTKMLAPFEDPEVFGVEPARFEAGADMSLANRWHALAGFADPLTRYIGNYARESAITGTWTGFPHESERTAAGWDRVTLTAQAVPVLGANGFALRLAVLGDAPVGDYYFDLDHVYELVLAGHRVIGRADVGVRHYFCDSLAQFARKTRRRADDFFYFSTTGDRTYPWADRRRQGIIRFALATVLVVPALWDAVQGFRRRPDAAWVFHVPACFITLYVYAVATVRGTLRPRMLDRTNWKQ